MMNVVSFLQSIGDQTLNMNDESAAIKTSLNTHMSNKYSHLQMTQVLEVLIQAYFQELFNHRGEVFNLHHS